MDTCVRNDVVVGKMAYIVIGNEVHESITDFS